MALLLGVIPFLAEAVDTTLPELGDSSSQLFSPDQERLIGREALRYMIARGEIKLLNDALVNAYIDTVGRSLAAHAEYDQPFTFFVVDDPNLNAFALPGGYIGVNSGLILASHTESELAAVIAHEISHVTQHHFTRQQEQQSKVQAPLQLAVLAAILLSGGDPDIISAAIAAGQGGSAQMQVNFTREHEYEADRIGMQLLASSEYDPHGMADFFQRLQNESRYEGGSDLEFLRTHPLTTTRISEAQSTAEHFPGVMRVDTTPYLITKARLRLHHSKSAAGLLKQLDSPANDETRKDPTTTTYLRAITLIDLQQPAKAEALLEKLLSNSPESIIYRESLGHLLYQQGQFDRAITLYREGLKRYPRNKVLSLSLVENLIAKKDYQNARSHLQEVLRYYPDSAKAFQLLGKLEAESGNLIASHLAQAERYRLLEDPYSALQQLKLAKRIKNVDFYHASRIEALSAEIEESISRQQELTKSINN